nr:HlyD family efflux transporter periplasmic adaptor subunit [uncultured Acetatifactor sp.]
MLKNKLTIWKTVGKKRRKWIAVGAALLLLTGAAGYTVFIAPLLEQEQWMYKEATVERGTLTLGVSESGTLEYGITSVIYDLDLNVAGGESTESTESTDNSATDETVDEDAVQKYLQIEEIYAVPGQRIEEGDAIVKFTEDSVADVRRLLESALVEARTAYNEAEAEYNLSVLEAQTDYDTQVAESKYAASIYNSASEAVGNDIAAIEVEIEQRNANVSLLEEELAEARETYSEALEEYEAACQGMETADINHTENFMTYQNAYISALTQYQNAKSAWEQAQQALEENASQIVSLEKELANARARSEIDRMDAEEAYQEAVIEGGNAQITYNAQIESLKETLEEAEKERNQVEEQLQDFEAFVGEAGMLYAGGSGIVTQVAYEEGDSLVQSGVILSYAAPEDMTISVDVTQEDVVDFKVGDQAEIVFTAYEETPYEGTILSIDTTATARNSNTVSYTVVVGVEGDTTPLYGGMTADITFVTEEKEDVLYVSRRAIVEENEKTYVYRQSALGGMELTEVETGVSNGVSIEILSGLSEGETIYIASRVSSEEEVESTLQENEESPAGSVQLPAGMELPEGLEIPEGMQIPEGTDSMEAPGQEGEAGTERPSGGRNEGTEAR